MSCRMTADVDNDDDNDDSAAVIAGRLARLPDEAVEAYLLHLYQSDPVLHSRVVAVVGRLN